MIDPGPRAIISREGGGRLLRRPDAGELLGRARRDQYAATTIRDYPQGAFRDNPLFEPSGPLDTLGELRIDAQGRLLVLPGQGRTAAMYDEYGDPIPLTGDLNNVGWFDDAADGPVSATLVFDDGDGPPEDVFGAWVVCGDPAYAPQIRNVVSVWDDVYDAWVRELDLQPEIFGDGERRYQDRLPAVVRGRHPPDLPGGVAAALDRQPSRAGRQGARTRSTRSPPMNPDATIMAGLAFIRNPNEPGELNVGVPLMPLSLGEAGKDFLTVSQTQYFFLEQWSEGKFDRRTTPLGPGEYLDMASLSNCLGGRYVPGIEVSYPVRQPDCTTPTGEPRASGPFRVKHT